MGWITWATAKEELDLQPAEETQITRLIEAATKEARRIVGRDLPAADYTETCDGHGDRLLLLKNGPVISVTRITISGSREFDEEDPLDTSEYGYYNQDAGMIRRYGTEWPVGEDNIQVVYRAGFEVLPDDVVNAMLEIVAWSLKRLAGGGQQIGVRTKVGDMINTTYETVIPINARRILEGYKWPEL